jgi:hypothetical protein
MVETLKTVSRSDCIFHSVASKRCIIDQEIRISRRLTNEMKYRYKFIVVKETAGVVSGTNSYLQL